MKWFYFLYNVLIEMGDMSVILPDEMLVEIAMRSWAAFKQMRLTCKKFSIALDIHKHKNDFVAVKYDAISKSDDITKDYYKLTVIKGKFVIIYKNGRVVKTIKYRIPWKGAYGFPWKLVYLKRFTRDDKYDYVEHITFAHDIPFDATRATYKDGVCVKTWSFALFDTAWDRETNRHFLYNRYTDLWVVL